MVDLYRGKTVDTIMSTMKSTINKYDKLLGSHQDWAEVRTKNSKKSIKQQVEMLRSGNDMADSALPLHKSIYTGEERFEAEKKSIFLDQPLVACLSNDIAEPGKAILFDAAGPSIIVSRDKDGQARAFLNMCTHRGAKITVSYTHLTLPTIYSV